VNSPAAGHVHAKTGTYERDDLLNDMMMVDGKGLAGYMTTADGRRLACANLREQRCGGDGSGRNDARRWPSVRRGRRGGVRRGAVRRSSDSPGMPRASRWKRQRRRCRCPPASSRERHRTTRATGCHAGSERRNGIAHNAQRRYRNGGPRARRSIFTRFRLNVRLCPVLSTKTIPYAADFRRS